MNKSNDKIKTTMDELEKIAPELSKIKKENPFRVPDNYFVIAAVCEQHHLQVHPPISTDR